IGLDQSHLIVGWGEPLQGKSPQPSAPAFFAPDFYLEDSQPWISFPSYALVARDTFLELLRKLNAPEGSPWNWEDPKKQYFEKSFELIQNEIAKNKIVKAVPVVFARAKTTVTAPS